MRKAFYMFFFVAVLLALGWNFLPAEEWKPIMMRSFVLFLGLSLGCLAFQGIKQKEVRFGPGLALVRRDRNPVNYWGIVILNSALALLLVVLGLFLRT